jgi:hypothetical protein
MNCTEDARLRKSTKTTGQSHTRDLSNSNADHGDELVINCQESSDVLRQLKVALAKYAAGCDSPLPRGAAISSRMPRIGRGVRPAA